MDQLGGRNQLHGYCTDSLKKCVLDKKKTDLGIQRQSSLSIKQLGLIVVIC